MLEVARIEHHHISDHAQTVDHVVLNETTNLPLWVLVPFGN